MKFAKWIWIKNEGKPDEYVRFTDEFSYDGCYAVFADISCDGNYNLYLNGKLVTFGQYSDYPHYKVYDKIDLTAYLRKGQNTLKIDVWYYGEQFSYSYFYAQAGLIYEIYSEDKVIAYSNAGVKCKLIPEYESYREKLYTVQIGYSYSFDAAMTSDEAVEQTNDYAYLPAVEVKKECSLFQRPIKKLALFSSVKGVLCDEVLRIYDLGKESCGYLHIVFKSPKNKKFSVGFGEYVAANGVLRLFDKNDLSVELSGNGEFYEYTNYFRRIGCRYIQIFADESVDIKEIGLEEYAYPSTEKPVLIEDSLLSDIYRICRDTLLLCRHEHYEDCPWREQALYTFDSRNQMLCGYYAFEGFEYARSNLLLMAKSPLVNGIMAHCFPCKIETNIPFYSLVYIIQIYEYIIASGDVGFLDCCIERIFELIDFFEKHKRKDGLISELQYFWNFYEFSDGLSGNQSITTDDKKTYSIILNSFYIIACRETDKMLKMSGKAQKYGSTINKTIAAAKKAFYDKKTGLYKSFEDKVHFSKLANALAILSGIAEDNKHHVAEELSRKNGLCTEPTLCMTQFTYDALLYVDETKYASYVIEDIKEKYGLMLKQGATSVWETLKGYMQYPNGSGSLCHGWSAVPLIYINRLKCNKKFDFSQIYPSLI